ncbi:hypothetical protein ACH5RR_006311 [Cinchona calisaya]|uniref:Uncharacterized protein n=1 Tax=Cinchona calisaya TaxID=153742 RepID=A0ABD3ANM1_9GENT
MTVTYAFHLPMLLNNLLDVLIAYRRWFPSLAVSRICCVMIDILNVVLHPCRGSPADSDFQQVRLAGLPAWFLKIGNGEYKLYVNQIQNDFYFQVLFLRESTI